MKIQLLGSFSFLQMILIIITTTKYWEDKTIPASLTRNINSWWSVWIPKKNWNGKFLYSRSVTNQSLSNLEANVNYEFNEVPILFGYKIWISCPMIIIICIKVVMWITTGLIISRMKNKPITATAMTPW
jgi:hypothetical protein